MSSTFSPGATLGRYKIERLLGTGAMGEVYLAEDPQIGRRVALKTLRFVDVRADELAERRQRLLREARTAGQLVHPHVVTLFDAGEDEGFIFLAFEYVAGSDLAARLGGGPPLSLGDALRLIGEACSGLERAHRAGIVHRDIKPSNLMLDEEGRLKISDFGIAKMAGQATELTVTGSVMGSPHYLSPEQIRGEELDGRSDLFSLGVVLYELLARRRPFSAETLSTLVFQILQDEPPALSELRPDLPPRLHALVARLLSKSRDDRPPTAAAVAAELAAVTSELREAMLAAPAGGGSLEGPTRLLESRPPAAPLPKAPPPPPPAAASEDRQSASPPPAPMAAPGATGAAAVSRPVGSHTGVGEASISPAAAGSYATAPAEARPAPPLPAPPLPAAKRSRRWWVPVALGCGSLAVLAAATLLVVLSREPLRPGEALRALAERPGEAATESPAGAPPGALEAGGVPATMAPAEDGESPDAGGADLEPVDWEIEPAGEGDPAGGVGGAAGESGGRPSATGSAAGGEGTGAGSEERASRPATDGGGSSSGPERRPAGSGDSVSGREDASSAGSGSTPGGAGGSSAGGTGAGSPAVPARSETSAPEPPGPAPPAPAPSRDVSPPAPPPDTGLTSGLGLAFRVMPADAFVLVDGTVIGRADEWSPAAGGRVYELPGPGTYDLTLRSPGMRDRRIRVRASADGPEVTAVAARLERVPADEVELSDLEVHRVREGVGFKVVPRNARVLVDGRLMGPAARFAGGFGSRRWLELPRGLYRVSLVAPGHQRVDLAVEFTGGAVEERKRIEVVLPPGGGPG